MGSFVFKIFIQAIAFCLLLAHSFAAESPLTSPPPNLPVTVETSFYLDDLIYIEDKAEVFTADVTFLFKWHDPRLAFPSETSTPKAFLERAAVIELQKIWWPEIEFISTDFPPAYDNRSLFISPDGTVEYIIGLTGRFRSRLNFESFPFDVQKLKIGVDSFVWDKNVVLFSIAPNPVKYSTEEMSVHKEATILDVNEAITFGPGPIFEHLGGNPEYSTYEINIIVKRKFGYYIYQVFVPLLIVLGISFTVFFDFTESLLAKVGFTLTAFLVFVAAKFAINQDLPRIGYMTMIDKVFVLCYVCFGLTVVLNVLQKIWRASHEKRAKMINLHARWAVPLAFIIALILVFLTSTQAI